MIKEKNKDEEKDSEKEKETDDGRWTYNFYR